MTCRILIGDCRDMLATLPDQSVHCCVTSPPYFQLRDYGVVGQIGLESSLEEYIETLVGVFREVKRVLRGDGTFWLNCGDSYASAWPCNRRSIIGNGSLPNGKREARPPRVPGGLKEKDLMMVPARVALALQADGWYLRSDIIWAKKAPMPESVTDRPTSAHEHVFLLTKQARYFYDAEAVKEEPAVSVVERAAYKSGGIKLAANGDRNDGDKGQRTGFADWLGGRNLRNVWHLGPEPFSAAHFATFVTEIPRRAILAGTSEKGCCAACGAPWVRVVERSVAYGSGSGKAGNVPNGKYAGTTQAQSGAYDIRMGPQVSTQTSGWQPSCSCDADVQPCTVLDPFAGAGTVGLVADRLGRNAILLELNPEYAAMAKQRITGDAPMFASVEMP